MNESGSKRIEVGAVLSESFSIYGANAAPLLGISAAIFVLTGILQGILRESSGLIIGLLILVVGVVAQAIYTGFVVKLVDDVRDGRRDNSVGELVSATRPAIVPLIVNGFLKGIAVGIGLLLLVVPGLILLTVWAVTSPAIVAGRETATSAFGRSWELVRGQAWPVFGVIVVAFLITFGATLVAVAIGSVGGVVGVAILAALAAVLTAPVPALVSTILFFDLDGGSAQPAATAEATQV